MTSSVCGALAILLGSIVLTGWAIHSVFLIQIAPNLAPMQPNTALSFLLSGIALLGIVIARPRLTLLASAITAAVSLASILEYLLHENFGIDELFSVAFITTHSPYHGRMSPTTALCFTVFALVTMLAKPGLFTN